MQMHHRIWLVRALAVAAAVFFVLSVLFATAEPYDMPMLQVLALIDPDWPRAFQDTVLGWFGHGFWLDAAQPLVVRPIWLLPACLTLLCAGGAFTLTPSSSPPTHRRS